MGIQQTLETAFRNFRRAARALAKARGFTATVIATLALGIGSNSAVLSAIYAVILQPLPYPHSERLVSLEQFNPKARQPTTLDVIVPQGGYNEQSSGVVFDSNGTDITSRMAPRWCPTL